MKCALTLMTALAAGVLPSVVCDTAAPGAGAVVIETVTVGNPGNPGDQPGLQCCNDPSFFGEVAYTFSIAKYEVMAGQYTEFLNAVAASDAHALYHVNMWTHEEGCKIERIGKPGSYTYSVEPDWANRPVNFVSWGDAARFANWLHNGQPTGAQDVTTTEDGSYFINGMTSDSQLEDVLRERDATWVVPSEDEWFKAAYHKNDGVTGNYWNYPMSVDFGISNDLADPDPGGHATYYDHPVFTIGAPYFRTEAGAHANSASPYGTFDQGGNVMEWNESIPLTNGRGLRGGAFLWGSDLLGAWSQPIEYHSSDQFSDIGFRLVNVATMEPADADLNGDGLVNAADLALLLGAWGECGDCAADFNGDGFVNAADLAILLGAWTVS